MERPEGLVGEPVFIVDRLRVGQVLKPMRFPNTMLLPVTVSVRIERCMTESETMDHTMVEHYLDFGITSEVWDEDQEKMVYPIPGLMSLHKISEPFTAEKIVKLHELEDFHQNSLNMHCVHQIPPNGPRGRRPAPCKKTGYVWGSKWLVRPLPDDFLTRIREIFTDADPEHVYDSGETR